MQSKEIASFSKLLEVVLEEKRREIIKEWIDSGRIKDMKNIALTFKFTKQ